MKLGIFVVLLLLVQLLRSWRRPAKSQLYATEFLLVVATYIAYEIANILA